MIFNKDKKANIEKWVLEGNRMKYRKKTLVFSL